MLCFDARHVHLRSREHFEGKLAASIDAPLFDQAHRSRVSWLGLHLLVLNLIYSGATRPVTLDQPDAHVESANAAAAATSLCSQTSLRCPACAM